MYYDTLVLSLFSPNQREAISSKIKGNSIKKEKQEQRQSRDTLARTEIIAPSLHLQQLGCFLFTLSLENKRTEPFIVPLPILTKLIKGTLNGIAIRDRLKTI